MKTACAAALAAFFFSLALCLVLMPLLKRLKAGQYILGYVKQHKDKSGTPTMGGLAFVCAAVAAGLCFCGVHSSAVNLTLTITAGYCLIGFADDLLKVCRRDNLGLRPYQKIIFQFAIAVIAAVYCHVNKLTVLDIPQEPTPAERERVLKDIRALSPAARGQVLSTSTRRSKGSPPPSPRAPGRDASGYPSPPRRLSPVLSGSCSQTSSFGTA